MANDIGRQLADYMKTGKAKVYAQLIDAEGNALTPVKDVGNCESSSLGVEREENSVSTGEDDNPAPARTFSRISAATLNLACRNWNPVVTIFAMQSDVTEHIQNEVPAGTHEEAGTFKVRDFIKLPHEAISGVTTFTDGADANPLTLDEHYKVDWDAGFVTIIKLPDGVESLDGVKIGYAASAVTVDSYNGFSQNGVLARIWIRETAEGPKGIYEFYRARVNKDGDMGIIDADSQDPMTAEFAISIESDPTKPAPGLFRYKKLQGSL